MDMEGADVLVDILRCLPPRSLAAIRCVCKAWRATVDDHRLLRTDILPLSLDGVIYETREMDDDAQRLFARRSTAHQITTGLEHIDGSPDEEVLFRPMYDCCSGLILLHDRVVNPATRQWARFPRLRHRARAGAATTVIADHAVSPHYEVLLIPCGCNPESVGAVEWPSSPYVIHVFSSKTRRWKDRSLVRQGDATGTAADMDLWPVELFHSAYWQGVLYVRSQYGSVLRYLEHLQ
ncbi:hypothetical protein CFC21_112338 [Triticum aestivum]|uniref:F-box domain-containing protein n=2 Tax=Triticum aestivum TaxID=4565 RepID=A0A3B6U9J8_WHEAT|nr:hypothetical protein [Triticum aestivum]